VRAVQPLTSVDRLARRLDADRRADGTSADLVTQADLVLCDVRWYLADHGRGRREYGEAHLPGAVFVDLHRDLAGGPGGGRHPLPTPADFAALLGRLGIEPSSEVVAYDDSGGAVAARLWWMLRSIGHRDVSVLDGGYRAWVEAGLPLTADVVVRPPSTYPVPDRWTGIATADDVARASAAGGVIVDARAAERYRGEIEPIDPRAGHVPGAVSLPHLDNLRPDGRHRPPAELAARFAAVGERPIVYCGSGVTACHDLLAMEVAGREDGLLYPGSWSEWSSDPDRPIATGEH
jgi:thiosulfate/3-mercaptopyruvate sulfurtransferase